jgi:Flp pilus assembly secretin CpaC
MTAKIGAFAVTLNLLLTASSATWAADQTVILRLGGGTALTLERAFKTVLIGNPGIVEVHTHNARSVIIEPLNLGATNLIFVDERSIAITNVSALVCNAGAVRIRYRGDCD